MASNSIMIHKLQHAINEKGYKILYSTSQFYSNANDRPVTIYSIKKAIYDEDKKKNRNIELFSSTSQIQILLFLRDYWYTINGIPLPQDSEVWNKIRDEIKEGKNGSNKKDNTKEGNTGKENT